tara:strand:- start:976 stop:1365 length:390 start_codon:yes stop_codon:yes gene_type:complete
MGVIREVEIEIMFKLHNKDFTQSVGKHYTSIDRLTNGLDNFDYDGNEIIAKRQFTGVQDINGTDIYVDDLLHELEPCQWKPSQVKFNDGAFYINLTKRCLYPINAKYIRENGLVIVGNTHENPDLVTQK